MSKQDCEHDWGEWFQYRREFEWRGRLILDTDIAEELGEKDPISASGKGYETRMVRTCRKCGLRSDRLLDRIII